MRMVLRMNDEKFVLATEIPCEWTFATKFASDYECDGVVHSGDVSRERRCRGPVPDPLRVGAPGQRP